MENDYKFVKQEKKTQITQLIMNTMDVVYQQ